MKVIEYKGETLETKHFVELTDEEYLTLKSEYYQKPDFSLVEKQFKTIHKKNGYKNNHITNYYVKDLMAKTKIYYNKWTIEDVFECKELLGRFVAQTYTNEKVYPQTNPLIKNIETALRLGGKGVASKPANFPMKTVDEILEQYNVNDNYYDFSCGWGSRLTSALKNKVNYYGTDPNYILVERLKQLAHDYKHVNNIDTNVYIRPVGSEQFQSDWCNKIGLAFSSPPYFCLEDYKIGKQSYTQNMSYEDWKNNYLYPTFSNIYYYLIQEGYFCLNINNFQSYNLVEDSIEIAKKVGFKLLKEHKLVNIKRCKSTQGFNDNSEKILVFCKEG